MEGAGAGERCWGSPHSELWWRPVDSGLLTQQRLGSLLELPGQPWALLQLSWEAWGGLRWVRS